MIIDTEPVWERSRWGQQFELGFQIPRMNKKGKPLQLENYFAPEGSRTIARCLECGGIHETLSDMRGRSLADAEPILESAGYIKDKWMPMHEGCADTPLKWEIPSMLTGVIESQIAEYRESFATEDDYNIANHIAVLSKAGVLYYIPYSDLEYGEKRTSESEARKFAVREQVRESNDNLLYQVSFMEAWGVTLGKDEKRGKLQPRHHPFRQEVLSITVETPDFTKTGHASITRLSRKGKLNEPASDDDFKGPAEMGELVWADNGFAHLLEGIMAANNRYGG